MTATPLPDRSQLRQALAGLLNSLTGTGGLVQAVYDHLAGDIDEQSPVIVVGSGGTERKAFTLRGQRASYRLDVWVFVLYAALDDDGKLLLDDQGAPAWTEADAAQALDQIEQQIGQLLSTNQRGAYWQAVDYAGQSQVDVVSIGGASYLRECIPLRFETF